MKIRIVWPPDLLGSLSQPMSLAWAQGAGWRLFRSINSLPGGLWKDRFLPSINTTDIGILFGFGNGFQYLWNVPIRKGKDEKWILFQVKKAVSSGNAVWKIIRSGNWIVQHEAEGLPRWTRGDWMLWLYLLELHGPFLRLEAAWGWDPSSLGVTIFEGAFSWDQSRVTLFCLLSLLLVL